MVCHLPQSPVDFWRPRPIRLAEIDGARNLTPERLGGRDVSQVDKLRLLELGDATKTIEQEHDDMSHP